MGGEEVLSEASSQLRAEILSKEWRWWCLGRGAFKQSPHLVILGGPDGSSDVEIPFTVVQDQTKKTVVSSSAALHLLNMKLY